MVSEIARLKFRKYSAESLELFHPSDPVNQYSVVHQKKEERPGWPTLRLFNALGPSDSNVVEIQSKLKETGIAIQKVISMATRVKMVDLSKAQKPRMDRLLSHHLHEQLTTFRDKLPDVCI